MDEEEEGDLHLFDIKRTPFTFKFDEKTNENVDKQNGGYMWFRSIAVEKLPAYFS